jgi:hypothetical protein
MLCHTRHANTSRLLKTIQKSDKSLLNVGISRSQMHYISTQHKDNTFFFVLKRVDIGLFLNHK